MVFLLNSVFYDTTPQWRLVHRVNWSMTSLKYPDRNSIPIKIFFDYNSTLKYKVSTVVGNRKTILYHNHNNVNDALRLAPVWVGRILYLTLDDSYGLWSNTYKEEQKERNSDLLSAIESHLSVICL